VKLCSDSSCPYVGEIDEEMEVEGHEVKPGPLFLPVSIGCLPLLRREHLDGSLITTKKNVSLGTVLVHQVLLSWEGKERKEEKREPWNGGGGWGSPVFMCSATKGQQENEMGKLTIM